MVCTVLYPTYRTGVECDRKAQTSCKRHLSCTVRFPVICKRVFLLVEFISFWHIVLTQKISVARNQKKILLVSLIYATYIRRINHPKAFKYSKQNSRIYFEDVTSPKTLHIPKASKPAPWPTKPFTEWEPGAPSTGIRWPCSGVNLTSRL